MEMMPHHEPTPAPPGLKGPGQDLAWAPLPTREAVTTTDWHAGLPVLDGPQITLRELRAEDAPSLLAHLTTEEVTRFIVPPPATVEEFEAFIDWTHRRRAQGRYVCFGIVPAGQTAAVGIFQVRLADPGGPTADWGFALGSAYWGSGMFLEGAQRVVDFAFAHMGIERLEACSLLANGRGNGALRKVGAVPAGVSPGSFERNGERFDQMLWTIAREDWWAARRRAPSKRVATRLAARGSRATPQSKRRCISAPAHDLLEPHRPAFSSRRVDASFVACGSRPHQESAPKWSICSTRDHSRVTRLCCSIKKE